MKLTINDFKELAFDYNILVYVLDIPSCIRRSDNTILAVNPHEIKTMTNLIMFLRQNYNTNMYLYLQDNGELFWYKDLVRYLRVCITPLEAKPKPISVRQVIYGKIDEERAYQDLKWSTGQRPDQVPDKDKSVAEWLNYIEYHLDLAKKNVYNLDKTAALDDIRKITALAVRCMEIHGCPERKPIVKSKTTAKTVETQKETNKCNNDFDKKIKKCNDDFDKKIREIFLEPSSIHFQTDTYNEWLYNTSKSRNIKD